MKSPKGLMHNSRFSPLQMLMFVLAFGLIGAYILIRSFAAPLPSASLKAKGPDTLARALSESQQLVAGAPVLKHASAIGDTTKHTRVKSDLSTVATERTKDLLDLMKTDPKSARQAILPDDSIAKLSSEGVATEQKQTITGRMRMLQVDNPDKTYVQIISTDNKIYTLDTEQKIPSIETGATIQASGYSIPDPTSSPGANLGSQFLVDASPTTNTYYSKDSVVTAPLTVTAPAASSSSASLGNINVAFLIGNIPGGQNANGQPGTISASDVRSAIEGNPGHDVKSYIAENSYGKATLVPAYFGAYDFPNLTCNDDPTNALIQAANSTITFSQYQVIALIANCGYRGSAVPLETFSTPQGTFNLPAIGVSPLLTVSDFTHEFMHALPGFSDHGAFFDCSPQTFIAQTRFGSDNDCVAYDYGDKFQVLGYQQGVGDLSPYHKEQKGWLTPGTTQYPLVTSSGTYTLSPYENGSGTVALKIPRGDGTNFTVEYRQPIGFDSWMNNAPRTSYPDSPCSGQCNVTQGASIRETSGASTSDEMFLDNTPGTLGAKGTDRKFAMDTTDGALLPGKTFTDSSTGIQISVVSADSSDLTVNVTIPPAASCTRAQPSVSAPSPSSQTGAPGVTKTYTFTVTNNDSASCKPNQFVFAAGSIANNDGDSAIATPDNFTLNPGASTTISVAVTPSSMDQDAPYYIDNSISANSLGTAGDSVTVPRMTYVVSTPADTTRPSTPANFKATAIGSRFIKLTWSPSTDNLGVAAYYVNDQNNDGCVVPAGVTTCEIGGYAFYPSTAYSFTIWADDHKSNQSAVATASATTLATGASIYPTNADLTATNTDHSLTLSWSPGYTRDPAGIAGYGPSLNGPFLPSNTLKRSSSGLRSQAGAGGDIDVCGADVCNFFSPGIGAYTAVEGSTSPSQPTDLYISSATSAGTTLNWSPSTDGRGIAYYKIFRDGRKIGQASSTTYTDTTAPGDDQYYVQAVNVDGSLSPPSFTLGGGYGGTGNPAANSSAPATPPIATITSPAPGDTLAGTITLSASVANVTNCTAVDYYIDGYSVANSTSAPYSVSFDTTSFRPLAGNGPHTIFALASNYQSYGCTAGPGMSSSGAVDVVFNNSGGDITAPTVSLTSPTNGSTVTGTVNITANATDNKAVDHVDFSVDGNLLSSVSVSPYSYSWNSSSVPNGTHTIAATAYDTSGNTAVSTVSATTANADTVKPSAPSNLTGSAVSQTAINLSWSASTDNVGVAGYYIIRDGVTIAQTTGTDTTYSDSNLSPATSYSYQVEAYDAANNTSDPSNTASVTTQSPAPDTQAPTAPTGLTAGVVSAYQVNLSWKASSDNVSVDHYDIYRSNTKIYSVPAAAATDSSGNVSFADLTAHAGTSYSYWLYAYDQAGNKSGVSNKVSVTTPKLVAGYASLTGRLTNNSGAPVSSAKVIYSYNGRTTSSSSNTTGNYVLSSIPAGIPLTFSYSLTGYLIQTLPLTLTADQNTIQDLTLHKLGIITGKITNSSTGSAISSVVVSYQLNGVAKTAKTGNTGVYTLTGLPAGSYSLTYTLSGYTPQTQTVSVDTDQTATQNVSLVHL